MNFKHPFFKHFIAVSILVIVSILYFYPETQGKKILSHDQVSSAAASKEYRDYQKESGESILWTSRLFSGMPIFLVSYRVQENILNNFYLIFDVFPKSMGLWFTLILGFYICLSLLGYSTEISLIGSIAFGLSTWFMLSIEAGHSSKILVIAFIPPMLASIVNTYRGKWLSGGILTALFLSLSIMLGHPQVVYYSIFFVLIIIFTQLYTALKNKTTPLFFKRSFILLAFAILAILPNTARLWSTYETSQQTIRGGKSELTSPDNAKQTSGLDIDYAMSWSYGTTETLNLLIPGFFGGGATLGENTATYQQLAKQSVSKSQIKTIPLYYGSQPFTSGPSYLGAAIIFLFILMLFIYTGRLKWMLLLTIILSITFAWGKNFLMLNEFLFNNLPLLNKFRTPSMWLILTMIATCWGAMLSLKTIFNQNNNNEHFKKSLLYTLGISAGTVLFVYLFKSSLSDFSGPYDAQLSKNGLDIELLVQDRMNMLDSDIFRTLFVIALTFTITWLFVMKKIKSLQLAYFLFAVIIIGDLWMVDKRYLNVNDFSRAKSFEKSIIASAADQQILADKEVNFRVFNTTVSSFNENKTSYFHQSTGGYSAAKLIRYQDLIEHHLSKGNINVFNMLNTKYFIVNQEGQQVAQQNPNALGPVWFVNNISWATNADDEINQLGNFNPKETVVIDQRFKDYLNGFTLPDSTTGDIKLSTFHPENMVYTSNSSTANFAVFSEIWYQGNVDWKAYIDDKESEFIRVNYLLRGLKIPKGQHEIKFKFHPKSHHTGKIISLIASIIITLLVLGLIVVKMKSISLPGLVNDNEDKSNS